ncbi:MAG: Hsp70 family protein [Pirellulaceae bacterium]
MTNIIGIDLGTTNSLCAVFQNGQPRLIPNALGQLLTPSVVGILESGEVLVGAAAKELAVTSPETCVARFKQWMGSDRKVTLRNRELTPVELSSFVLRSLKEDAERFLNGQVAEAVITVPAYFNDGQRRATKMAGSLAGFKVRRIINEPTAAALTYGFHDKEAEKQLVVLDLGGGTFDVTLMEVFDGSLEIVATAGENFLGGEEFTDRLAAELCKRMGLQFEQAELTQPLMIARLRQNCELAKRALADSDQVVVRVPNKDGSAGSESAEVHISRHEFARLSQPLLDRLQRPIHKVLRDANLTPEQVDEVILVGGATRMPVLQQFVAEQLACQPRCELNPDEVVALGAAVQAALIQDDAAVEDMVMTDVCPHTLGVEVVKELGGQLRDGYYTPIIHRNTTIPVSKEQTLYTVQPNQTVVNIAVYQGESRRVAENVLLGQVSVNNVPIGPAGQPIVIRFTYDVNGILEVEAFMQDSDERFVTVISTDHSMTDEELEEAQRRMQAFKFYPRDDIHNRHLLHYAEQTVGEVNPLFREQLESAVDHFETAMSAGDPEIFDTARTNLLSCLASLGFPFDQA